MARWGVAFNKGSASVQGVGYLAAAASSPRRAKVYEITFGSGATPGDNVFIHVVQRMSGVGSLAGTAKTPNALDPADSLASTIVATDTVTADSANLTSGAFLKNVALNQRATFRWVAAPYGELIIPATANNGLMLGVSAATTSVLNDDAMYEEY